MNKKHTKNMSHIGRLFAFMLAFCYLLSPLQQTLRFSVHDISHAFSTVKAEQHTHDNLMKSKMGRRALAHHQNTHTHKVLSFFDALFDNNTSTDPNQKLTNVTVDKYIAEIDYPVFSDIELTQDHNFHYITSFYKSDIAIQSPPPKHTS